MAKEAFNVMKQYTIVKDGENRGKRGRGYSPEAISFLKNYRESCSNRWGSRGGKAAEKFNQAFRKISSITRNVERADNKKANTQEDDEDDEDGDIEEFAGIPGSENWISLG